MKSKNATTVANGKVCKVEEIRVPGLILRGAGRIVMQIQRLGFLKIKNHEWEITMKKIMTVILLGILGVSQSPLYGAQGPMEKFAAQQIEQLEGQCMTELETFCQDVTPGEGRGVACLYAHSDKLSTPCLTALYQAKGEFKNAIDNVNVFVEDCREDILAECSKVAIGEGRILACLEKNKKKISAKCSEGLGRVRGDLSKANQVG